MGFDTQNISLFKLRRRFLNTFYHSYCTGMTRNRENWNSGNSVWRNQVSHTQTLSHMSLADFCSMCATTICQQKEGECLQQQAVSAATHHAAPLSTTFLHEPPSEALMSMCTEWQNLHLGHGLNLWPPQRPRLLHLKGGVWTGGACRASRWKQSREQSFGPEETPHWLMKECSSSGKAAPLLFTGHLQEVLLDGENLSCHFIYAYAASIEAGWGLVWVAAFLHFSQGWQIYVQTHQHSSKQALSTLLGCLRAF